MLAELQRLQTLIHTLTRQLQEARMENEALANQPPPPPPMDTGLKDEVLKLGKERLQLQQDLNAITARYESLALAHQTMSTEMERLANELAQQALARQQLSAERDALLQKNEHAKRKVEAIIGRLASLGQPSDQSSETAV